MNEGKPKVNAALITTLVTRNIQPLCIGSTGRMTIGERIDNAIHDALERGDTIQAITLEINEETWKELQDMTINNRGASFYSQDSGDY